MYEALAGFAQIWGLLYFVLLFLAAVLYAFRPRNRARFDEASQIPFQED